jgi:hypothetical protein
MQFYRKIYKLLYNMYNYIIFDKIIAMKSFLAYDQIVEQLVQELNFPSQKDLVLYLVKLLKLKEASIYNKLNGRSHFNIEELFAICSSANISLDSILQQNAKYKSLVPYYSEGLKYMPRTYQEYFINLIKYYSKIKKMEQVKGYFLASEVPQFHMLFFPRLMYLKMYLWNHLNWNIPGYGHDYKPDDFIKSSEIKYNVDILKDLFYSFPTVEIWNPSMLDITISQILYLRDLKIITDKKELEKIIKELNDLIAYLENLTITGLKVLDKKKAHSTCEIYIADLAVGSELILVKSSDGDLLFQQLDSPNYIMTIDKKMCDYINTYIDKIKQKATLITKSGAKDKKLFFMRMREQLKRLESM